MPDYDDSLGGQTMGGEDDEDRFKKSLRDEHTMGGDEIKTLPSRGFFSSVAFSPDGKTIASGSDDETIKLWDVSALTAS